MHHPTFVEILSWSISWNLILRQKCPLQTSSMTIFVANDVYNVFLPKFVRLLHLTFQFLLFRFDSQCTHWYYFGLIFAICAQDWAATMQQWSILNNFIARILPLHVCGSWLASSSSVFEKLPGRQPLKRSRLSSESICGKPWMSFVWPNFNTHVHVQSYGHPNTKKIMTNSTFSTATYLSRCHPRATSRWCPCTTVFPGHELPTTKESELYEANLNGFFWNSIASSSSRAFLTFGSWRSAHTRHQNFVFINSPVPFHWNYNYYHGFWNRPEIKVEIYNI